MIFQIAVFLIKTYVEKTQKYSDLKNHCREKFNRDVYLYIIIVSSLGAVDKDTIEDVSRLYKKMHIHDKNVVQKKLRRMCINALIGSYFIFYNIPFREDDKHGEEEPITKSSEETGNNRAPQEEEEELQEEEETPYLSEVDELDSLNEEVQESSSSNSTSQN